MIILGIESSCDDTSVALVEHTTAGFKILSEKTASQIEIHKKYGGVVPEVAGRMHAEKILPLLEEVLKNQPTPDAIAVTSGPGLITGLIVGVEAARALSYLTKIPLVAVNHLTGHIHSVEIGEQKIIYPALALIASGGHTEIVQIKKQGQYKLLGATLDDAAGECFDKVAKLLGLPYPGGPQISRLAATGKTDAINFPRPMLKNNNFNFSFSGLKTSALYWLRDNKLAADKIISHELPARIYGQTINPITTNDFCASFEQAIIDVLVEKTIKAAKKTKPRSIILGGGVAANKKLREYLANEIKNLSDKINFLTPNISYAMDNAVMIAIAGYYLAKKKKFTTWKKIQADPNWRIC